MAASWRVVPFASDGAGGVAAMETSWRAPCFEDEPPPPAEASATEAARAAAEMQRGAGIRASGEDASGCPLVWTYAVEVSPNVAGSRRVTG